MVLWEPHQRGGGRVIGARGDQESTVVVRERCLRPILHLLPSLPVKSRGADPTPHQLQRWREWALHLPEQHSKADPVDKGLSDSPLRTREWESGIAGSNPCLPCGCEDKEKMSSLHPPLTIATAKGDGDDLPLYQLQHCCKEGLLVCPGLPASLHPK